jgi:hypothetical protein
MHRALHERLEPLEPCLPAADAGDDAIDNAQGRTRPRQSAPRADAIRSTTVALVAALLASCATLKQDTLDQRHGPVEPTRFDQPRQAAAT